LLKYAQDHPEGAASVRSTTVIADLSRAKNFRIVILNACRDNPLAERLRMSLPASRRVLAATDCAKMTHSRINAVSARFTRADLSPEAGNGTTLRPLRALAYLVMTAPRNR
jgi:hypothetical protein